VDHRRRRRPEIPRCHRQDRTPLHATSGRQGVPCPHVPDRRTDCLSGSLECFTEHTITNRHHLEEQLATLHDQGDGFTLEEYEVGFAAVAAPIRNLDGHVVAAVSVSGPNFRLNPDTIPGVAEHVIHAAAEISQHLGQPKPS
jgi:DNA-binding IclR family transcriptional regulator